MQRRLGKRIYAVVSSSALVGTTTARRRSFLSPLAVIIPVSPQYILLNVSHFFFFAAVHERDAHLPPFAGTTLPFLVSFESIPCQFPSIESILLQKLK